MYRRYFNIVGDWEPWNKDKFNTARKARKSAAEAAAVTTNDFEDKDGDGNDDDERGSGLDSGEPDEDDPDSITIGPVYSVSKPKRAHMPIVPKRVPRSRGPNKEPKTELKSNKDIKETRQDFPPGRASKAHATARNQSVGQKRSWDAGTDEEDGQEEDDEGDDEEEDEDKEKTETAAEHEDSEENQEEEEEAPSTTSRTTRFASRAAKRSAATALEVSDDDDDDDQTEGYARLVRDYELRERKERDAAVAAVAAFQRDLARRSASAESVIRRLTDLIRDQDGPQLATSTARAAATTVGQADLFAGGRLQLVMALARNACLRHLLGDAHGRNGALLSLPWDDWLLANTCPFDTPIALVHIFFCHCPDVVELLQAIPVDRVVAGNATDMQRHVGRRAKALLDMHAACLAKRFVAARALIVQCHMELAAQGDCTPFINIPNRADQRVDIWGSCEVLVEEFLRVALPSCVQVRRIMHATCSNADCPIRRPAANGALLAVDVAVVRSGPVSAANPGGKPENHNFALHSRFVPAQTVPEGMNALLNVKGGHTETVPCRGSRIYHWADNPIFLYPSRDELFPVKPTRAGECSGNVTVTYGPIDAMPSLLPVELKGFSSIAAIPPTYVTRGVTYELLGAIMYNRRHFTGVAVVPGNAQVASVILYHDAMLRPAWRCIPSDVAVIGPMDHGSADRNPYLPIHAFYMRRK
jgi:hypothetical protein